MSGNHVGMDHGPCLDHSQTLLNGRCSYYCGEEDVVLFSSGRPVWDDLREGATCRMTNAPLLLLYNLY